MLKDVNIESKLSIKQIIDDTIDEMFQSDFSETSPDIKKSLDCCIDDARCIIDVTREKWCQFDFLKKYSDINRTLNEVNFLENITQLNPKGEVCYETINEFIKYIIIPMGYLVSLLCILDFLSSIKRREEGTKKVLDIYNEYEEIPFMYLLDQLTNKFLLSHGLDDDNLTNKEKQEYTNRAKNIIVNLCRFYIQNKVISSAGITQYGKYIFDDPRDRVDLLTIKRINDKEFFKRGKKPFEFLDKNITMISKYEEEKFRLPQEVRLLNFMCHKVDFSKIEKSVRKDKILDDIILQLPEFSKIPTKGTHQYLHYKFEDEEGVVDGEISWTKLCSMLSYCI